MNNYPDERNASVIFIVAAMLLLFCLVTSRTQKAYQLPLSKWPVY